MGEQSGQIVPWLYRGDQKRCLNVIISKAALTVWFSKKTVTDYFDYMLFHSVCVNARVPD